MPTTTRRALLGACGAFAWHGFAAARAATSGSNIIAAIERSHGGSIGAYAFDTGSGRSLSWRADETFPMQSTFKGPLAALVLQRVQDGRDRLDQRLPYGPADMMPVSPVTLQHLHDGALSIGALTAAILEVSDNTAANLLLAHVGGPASLTRYIRTLGDDVTTIRRPEMADPPGTVENTTTPFAFAKLTRTTLLGGSLEPSSRGVLRQWMAGNVPGRARLRAAFPQSWFSVDRTGTGDGICNDCAVAWPLGKAPLVVSVSYVASGMDLPAQEAVLREVSRAVVDTLT